MEPGRLLKKGHMPSPRDLTGELVRMRKNRPLAHEAGAARPATPAARPMAFDPVLWISGAVILAGLALQGAFIGWMW